MKTGLPQYNGDGEKGNDNAVPETIGNSNGDVIDKV